MKKKELIFFSIIFIGLIIYDYLISFLDLDLIWVYAYSNNITKCLLPYKDFNMIITPLFPFINSLFLLILPNKILTFIIIGSLIKTMMFYLIHKIIILFKTENYSYTCISILIMLIFTHITYGYNLLSIIFILLIIYLEIKNLNYQSKRISFLIGILISLTILTKQSIGLATLFISLIYLFINKKNIKVHLLGISLPIIIFIIYLYLTKTMSLFIDYTVLGMKEFASKNTYSIINLLISFGPFIAILSLLIPLVYFRMFKKYQSTKDKKILIIFLYSLASLTLLYPIFDSKHLILGVIPSLILLFISLKNNNYISFSSLIITTFLIIISLGFIFNKNDKLNVIVKESKYQNMLMSEYSYESLKIMKDYINKSTYDIKIFDQSNIFFSVYLNTSNGYFETYNLGNFGYHGEDSIINKINNMSNTLILIEQQDKKGNKQIPFKIKNYIKTNYDLVDTILWYDVYEINN